MTKYYEWYFNQTVDRGWFLAEPEDSFGTVISPWKFKSCEPLSPFLDDLSARVLRSGEVTGVAFGAFDLIYAMREWADILQEIGRADIELIPVKVVGTEVVISLVNVIREIRCIDEERSEFSKWELDSIRPDKVGEFKVITKMVIDTSLVCGAHIFRPSGYHLSVIVSEQLKHRIEELGSGYTTFRPV
ncbi:hypothetical protein FHW58_000559 [Duganella sp. 1224]|uniref:imm11 family protein n=1 Tax=Duganella sp. 1224 TaxID=2587052 RepID=UPI0015CBD6E0|nr:DUF1629 domain-containing protein [Duganella sp. 1224]NYE59407.1 hypothetical protein [Duganella sp. 1224]